VLSIVSLVVGVGAAFLSGHHGCHLSCHSHHQSQAERVDKLREKALHTAIAGDFEKGERYARKLLKLNSSEPYHHEMLAYALRGQNEPHTSIVHYQRAVELAKSDKHADSLVLADSYIGLAANEHTLEQDDEALHHADMAIKIAEARRRIQDKEADYYQLACAYAVRSTISDGPQQLRDRGSALANLHFAIDLGFDNWKHMAGDLDLKALHGDAAFEELFPDDNVTTPSVQYER
jgi:tetratricopeptide (TPR) repeat protein